MTNLDEKKLDDFPQINWIKNDIKKFNMHTDGNRYLIALQVRSKSEPKKGEYWDFFIVTVCADGDGAQLNFENGDIFDCWNWDDVEYFALLDGEMPYAEY